MGTGNESKLASYIGISGPETPKFLLANNFLAEFFPEDENGREKQYSYQDFFESKILICEEDDEQKKKQLEESFNCFFQRFSGEDMILFNDKRHYYFPIKPQMLRGATYNLRHLLYCMIPDIEDEKIFRQVQELLAQYLYSGADGVSYLMGVICGRYFGEENRKKKKKGSYDFDMLKAANFRNVRNHFKKDLYRLLQHRFFRNLDFYKRFDYLATLLDFYVIQFIINKKSITSNRGFLLCQGSSHLANGEAYHLACVQNYAEIRFVFQVELKEFYIECLKEEQVKDQDILIKNASDKILVCGKKGEEEFIQFVKRVFNSNFNISAKDTLYPSIRKVFALDGRKVKLFSAEEFVMCYIDMSRARKGASLTKISSALNTCGKDIEFVFPRTQSRHKYFALSPSLLEFLVRLYLAREESTYAYLDNFLDDLQDTYGICIQKNEQMDKILKNLHMKVPFQEFRQNEQALIDNLDEINCLIRLSDSGYVVTLPEEKGEFSLL